MEIKFNPTVNVPGTLKNELSMNTVYGLINDNVETAFGHNKDKTGKTYIVFDGSAKVLCKGTMEECFCYYEMFYRYQGFHPMVYSYEKYKEMLKDINKYYK